MKKLILILVIASQLTMADNYYNAASGNQVDVLCPRDLAVAQKDIEQLKEDNRILYNGFKREKEENVSSTSPIWYLLGGVIIGGAATYFGVKK